MLRDRLQRRTAQSAVRKSSCRTHRAQGKVSKENVKQGHGLLGAARWQLHPYRTGTLEYACGSLGRPRHRRHAMWEQWFEGSKRLRMRTQAMDVDGARARGARRVTRYVHKLGRSLMSEDLPHTGCSPVISGRAAEASEVWLVRVGAKKLLHAHATEASGEATRARPPKGV